MKLRSGKETSCFCKIKKGVCIKCKFCIYHNNYKIQKCGHKCCLTFTTRCCLCSDKREKSSTNLYLKYVDRMGYLYINNRSADYCPICK
jgi:hypothetical protein